MPEFPIQNLPTGFPATFPNVAINNEGLIFKGQLDNGQIFITRGELGLESWSSPIKVTNATSPELPAICCVENRLYVAWMASDGSHTLYYTVSLDNGLTFQPVINVSNVILAEAPAMIVGPFPLVIFKMGEQAVSVALQ